MSSQDAELDPSTVAARIPAPQARGPVAESLSQIEVALLSKLATCTFPYGARLSHQHLVGLGFNVSEASVSRLLQEFDEAGLTERAGSKGRLITAAGKQLVETILESRQRDDEFARALDISTLEQVFDLLYARRGLEGESARAAAMRVGAEDLADLHKLLNSQRRDLFSGIGGRQSGLAFHRAIARLSGNSLLMTVSNTLLNQQLDALEQVLDVITGSHGSGGESPNEHAQILDALATGDPDAAETAMRQHLSRLIAEVEEFALSEGASNFGTVLDLAQG